MNRPLSAKDVGTAPAPGMRRTVRSFVRREGRLTPGQSKALELHWPRYGIEPPAAALDLAVVFGRTAPVVVEIGFGNGDHLLARAQAEPERDFLGIEVHRPGVGRLLHHAAAASVGNLKVACADAVEVIRDWLAPASLSEIQILFPDPWHKKRHHKRRLVQPAFAALLASRLAPGGRLHLATDWANYAEQMRDVLNADPALRNLVPDAGFSAREGRAVTKFEARGTRLGHAVFDLEYRRT